MNFEYDYRQAMEAVPLPDGLKESVASYKTSIWKHIGKKVLWAIVCLLILSFVIFAIVDAMPLLILD